MTAPAGSDTLRPRVEALRLGSHQVADLTRYTPPRRIRDARGRSAGVVVIAAPGESRAGYARTFTELAHALGADGITTCVVGLKVTEDPGPDLVTRWRTAVDRIVAMLAEEHTDPALLVTRGIACAALPTDPPAPVAAICPVTPSITGEKSALSREMLLYVGFEEIWEHSPMPTRLIAAAMSRMSTGGAEQWTAILPASDNVTNMERWVHRQAGPGSVADPLFRRVWERAWLVAILRCLARGD
jgi:hypothetical protein